MKNIYNLLKSLLYKNVKFGVKIPAVIWITTPYISPGVLKKITLNSLFDFCINKNVDNLRH